MAVTLYTLTTWLIALIALAGVILNIHKHRACFYLWAVTNAAWTVIDYHKQIYAQAALFFIYFLLALWGIYKWTKETPHK